MTPVFIVVMLAACGMLPSAQADCYQSCYNYNCQQMGSSATSYCNTCSSNSYCHPGSSLYPMTNSPTPIPTTYSYSSSSYSYSVDEDVDTGKAAALLTWAPMVPLSTIISIILIVVASLPACCNVCVNNAKCIGWLAGLLGGFAAFLFVIYGVILGAGGNGYGVFVAIPLLFTVGCGFLPFILGGIASIIGCIACCKKPTTQMVVAVGAAPVMTTVVVGQPAALPVAQPSFVGQAVALPVSQPSVTPGGGGYNHLSFCNGSCGDKCNGPAYAHKSFCNGACGNVCNGPAQ